MKRLVPLLGVLLALFASAWAFDHYFLWLIYPEDLIVRALDGHDSGIYAYHVRLRTLTRLTTPDVKAFSPVWSPDHEYIAYFYEYGDGSKESGIRIMKRSGETDKNFSTTASADPILAGGSPPVMAWSPDGKYIFFNGYSQKKTSFYILEVDSGKISQVPLRLVHGEGNSLSVAWAPSKTLILESVGKIYQVDENSGDVHYLTDGSDPFWRPDGKLLAYLCNEGRQQEFCVCAPDGSDREILFHQPTRVAASGAGMYWSQDGRYIFYMSYGGESDPIYIQLFDTKTGLLHNVYESLWDGPPIVVELAK